MSIAASRATYVLGDWRIISTRRMDDKHLIQQRKVFLLYKTISHLHEGNLITEYLPFIS